MSDLVCFSIVFLSALSHAFFQLDLGGLLLLYHSSLGKNITKKTRVLVSNYLLGVLTMILLSLLSTSFIFLSAFQGPLSVSSLVLLIGILFILASIIFFFYYRSSSSTELWLPRPVARYINSRAKTTSSRVEAFSLGLLTSFAEIPLSLILFVFASDSLLKLSPKNQLLAILLYLFVSTLPLLICRFFVKRGKTIAEIQRWRLKNKLFLKVLGVFGLIILALFIFAYKVTGEFC